MNLYQLDNISKLAGQNKILDIQQLTIEQSKIYALLGANGAGKTTLLNILGFLERPTNGDLFFKEEKVNFTENNLQKLRRRVVMVNQRPILFSTTVFKNMEFGLKIRKIPAKLRKQIILENLALVGLSHLIHAPANKLSGGETQRIVLARALALSPEIILCDEPTSSVDLESQQNIIRLLQKINQEKGITVILTSHNQPEVNTLAHRSFVIDRGKISDVVYDNLFSALFTNEDGIRKCHINNCIHIPYQGNVEGEQRIVINPVKIKITQENSGMKNGDNLVGPIKQIMSIDPHFVQLKIDCGITLVVTLANDQYKNQRLMVGQIVRISIPSDAIQLL